MTLIVLLLDLLLDQVLMGRVVGINDHDGLPPALAALGVGSLEGGRGDEDGERQALGINTGLDELLTGAEILVTVDNGHSGAHGGDPGRKNNAVAVLATPFHEALGRSHVGQALLFVLLLAGLDIVQHRVLGTLEGDAILLGQDDGAEGTRRGNKEGAEGERELADKLIALHAQHDTTETDDETAGTSDQTALDYLAVVGRLLFLADDLHGCCWCRVTFDGGGGSGGGIVVFVAVREEEDGSMGVINCVRRLLEERRRGCSFETEF